jgi:hypothetical protein
MMPKVILEVVDQKHGDRHVVDLHPCRVVHHYRAKQADLP